METLDIFLVFVIALAAVPLVAVCYWGIRKVDQ